MFLAAGNCEFSKSCEDSEVRKTFIAISDVITSGTNCKSEPKEHGIDDQQRR